MKGEYERPKPGAIEGRVGGLTPEQEALADSNLARAKLELAELKKSDLSDSIRSTLHKRELSLSERISKLERYMTAVAAPLSGPMLTPSMARNMVREELLAHAVETHHNQAAYHATVNVAYVRAREVKVICEMLVDALVEAGSELAPKFKERLTNIEQDYQRELNHAIRDALRSKELKDVPSLDEVKRRLS